VLAFLSGTSARHRRLWGSMCLRKWFDHNRKIDIKKRHSEWNGVFDILLCQRVDLFGKTRLLACCSVLVIDVVCSRLIDGKFPDYRQLIPQQSQTEIIVSRADLSRITKVASLFARDSGGGVTINASAENNIISIHSIASELGENTSEATAKISADGQITLNSRYLTEALNVTDGDEVSFAFSGKLSPCIIQSTAKKRDYIHIIMPLKS